MNHDDGATDADTDAAADDDAVDTAEDDDVASSNGYFRTTF